MGVGQWLGVGQWADWCGPAGAVGLAGEPTLL